MRASVGVLVLLVGCGGRATKAVAEAPVDASSVVSDGAQPSTDASPVADGAPFPADALCIPIDFDAAPMPEAGFAAPDSAMTTACTASNFLDRDSFDVVGSAITACFECQPQGTCASMPDSLSLGDLEEGVPPTRIDYGTAADGTHTLVAHEAPGVAMVASGIVFDASGIPSSITFSMALQAFFVDATPPFPCAVN